MAEADAAPTPVEAPAAPLEGDPPAAPPSDAAPAAEGAAPEEPSPPVTAEVPTEAAPAAEEAVVEQPQPPAPDGAEAAVPAQPVDVSEVPSPAEASPVEAAPVEAAPAAAEVTPAESIPVEEATPVKAAPAPVESAPGKDEVPEMPSDAAAMQGEVAFELTEASAEQAAPEVQPSPPEGGGEASATPMRLPPGLCSPPTQPADAVRAPPGLPPLEPGEAAPAANALQEEATAATAPAATETSAGFSGDYLLPREEIGGNRRATDVSGLPLLQEPAQGADVPVPEDEDSDLNPCLPADSTAVPAPEAEVVPAAAEEGGSLPPPGLALAADVQSAPAAAAQEDTNNVPPPGLAPPPEPKSEAVEDEGPPPGLPQESAAQEAAVPPPGLADNAAPVEPPEDSPPGLDVPAFSFSSPPLEGQAPEKVEDDDMLADPGPPPQLPMRTLEEKWEADSDDGLAASCQMQAPLAQEEPTPSRMAPQLDYDEDEEQWERLAETLPEVPPPAENPPPLEVGEEGEEEPPQFIGEIKKVGAEYGFISCEEIFQYCGRDVYIKRLDLPDVNLWKAQLKVSFCLKFSDKGHPQAWQVETDPAKFPKVSCKNPEMYEHLYRFPTPPPSPKRDGKLEGGSPTSLDTPSRSAQPKGEAWADVMDEDLHGDDEHGPRQRRRRSRFNKGREARPPPPERMERPPLRALPLYAMNTGEESDSSSPSPRRDDGEKVVDREVVEAGAAGSTMGTVPLHTANGWIPALWSSVDIVRALCLQRPRDFLLKVEGELVALAGAPRGTQLCFPPLAPYYRALLKALCVRFGMKDTGSSKGHRRPVYITHESCRRYLPISLAALVPGTWAGQDPKAWAMETYRDSRQPTSPGIRIQAAVDLAAYAPDAPGAEADGDRVELSHGSAEMNLAPGNWKFMERVGEEYTSQQGGFVLTFSLQSSQAAGGVGVALCGNRAAAGDQLQQILSGHSQHGRTVGEDVYTVLFKPCPMGGNWSVRFGHAEQVGDGLQSAGVPLWKRETAITFWLATHTSPDGRACVDVGLDRFPWCRLFGVRLQRPAFSHVALAALSPMQGVPLSCCRVEWGLCNDWASRDHIVHLAWNGPNAPPTTPKTDGLVAVVGDLAVCRSSSAARSYCSCAVSQGWEARSLATFPIDSFGSRSRIGAGTSAADVVRQRMEMASALGPDVALELGLHEWAMHLGFEEREDSSGEEHDPRGLSATAASFVPGGAEGSMLSADASEFTPGAPLASRYLDATAPSFTPGEYDYDGGIYGYPPYADGSWPPYGAGGYGEMYPGDMRSHLCSSAAAFMPSGRSRGKGKGRRGQAGEYGPDGEAWETEGRQDRWSRRARNQDEQGRGKVRPPAYKDIRLREQGEDGDDMDRPNREDSGGFDALLIKAQRPPPGRAARTSHSESRRTGKGGDWEKGGWQEEEEEDEEVVWTKGKGGSQSQPPPRDRGDRGDRGDRWEDHDGGRWRDSWRDDRWQDNRRWRQDNWESSRWERNDWERRDDWSKHSWKKDRWRQDDWQEGRRPQMRHRRQEAEEWNGTGARPPMRSRRQESSSSSSSESSEESDSEDVRMRPPRTGRTGAPSAPSQPGPASDGEAPAEAPKPAIRQLPKANIVNAAAFHRFALGHLMGGGRRKAAAAKRGDAEPEAAEEAAAKASPAPSPQEPPEAEEPGAEKEAAASQSAEEEEEVMECPMGVPEPREEVDEAPPSPRKPVEESQGKDPECTADRHEGAAGHPECTAEGPE